jgi:hypothetical protein
LAFAGIPETSTWTMLALGFLGLGYTGFHHARREARVIDQAMKQASNAWSRNDKSPTLWPSRV